ncbi:MULTISPECIES: hypothetical protein [unclassified Bradyrhizobium]|jgi:hypothetical protein|uniref:hypothetical protein n=1 Tax=unclassified Bradyrhizobium TaxID=2631580 RepID=UPI001FFBD65A|nr:MULTISPECIES: hypothetical protein [unclassified Bradyrhizobium]MCK1483791.1 hypothetical protein [Bradyrhizobium sp. 193]MCK1500206.1 hypothetical protein [Bradyrhizobium sp. 188]MCK1549621.1 hypothetical protein [Bradyrhizobium sp. 177]MCK1569607.1 hypothetical protein [Bradyrhizobium sp. 173]UPJ84765.1 hypothetical protein IVB17_39165 [Bradyrhizobium sp. 184]
MLGQSRPLLRMISWLRAMRVLLIAPEPAAREASPMLAFTVVVLMLLLVILEVDLHSTGLQSLGLMDDAFSIDPVFKSP